MKRTTNPKDNKHATPEDKSTSPNEKLPWWWSIVLVVVIALVICLPFIATFKLPEPLAANVDPERFSGLQAKLDLQDLVLLGPRPVGSLSNEELTVNYLLKKIDLIKAESSGPYKIETDVQRATGAVPRNGWVDQYESIQNVIVTLTPISPVNEQILLINSHFDSVVGSPGGGDDGSMVVVMLGVLRALMQSKEAVRHSIIFLFNGAEETGLQGAHAFISQYASAPYVGAFINLEAMGVGGKEILFQSGPERLWLLDYYSAVAKHPFATVIGEELFESRFIPSDTDFTMFNRVGHLSGLNFAYVKHGYLYHTPQDRIEFVEDGALQHTGDNILALTRALANAPELDYKYDLEEPSKRVYFDVFALFMINYSEKVGVAINLAIGCISLIVIGISILLIRRASRVSLCDIIIQFALTIGFQLGTLAIAAGVVLCLGFLVDAIDYSMAWFSQSWLIFGIYICPFIFVLGIFPPIFLAWKRFNVLSPKFSILLFLHSNCTILAVFIFILTSYEVRATYLLTFVVLFYLVSLIINIATGLHQKARFWIISILICQMVPVAFISYNMQLLLSIFIPIAGRQAANPELYIAYFTIGFTLLMFGFIMPIFSIFHKAKIIVTSTLVVFIVCFILIFTSVGFPYTAKTNPQRQTVIATKRASYNFAGTKIYEDSLNYMYVSDKHGLRTLQDIANKNGLELHPASDDLSGLQYYSKSFYWTSAPPPILKKPAKLSLVSKTETGPFVFRYTFEITNIKNFKITISPLSKTQLYDWSFHTPSESIINNKYIINLKMGYGRPSFRFWLLFKVPDSSEPVVAITLHSEYSEENVEHSTSFENFVKLFPDWTCVTKVTETFDSYLF